MSLEAEAKYYAALKASLLTAMPELADDPDCLLDTLEGQTTIHNRLAVLLRSAQRDEAMLFALKDIIARNRERADRLAGNAQRKRQVALQCMNDLDLKKIEAPDMTITRMRLPPSVMVIDEDKIPKEYMRVQYTPNKIKIGNALKDGETVEGCVLSNAGETISIKVT